MDLPRIEEVYKDAGVIYDQFKEAEINDKDFYSLIKYFWKSYLYNKKWAERAAKHRNPIALHNEILQQSYDYLQVIDRRAEMQDIYIKEGMNISANVPLRVRLILEEDKTLRSLYQAVQYYCEIAGKEFTLMAVHIAERRALMKVGNTIRRELSKLSRSNSQGKVQVQPAFIESIIDGIRELQQQYVPDIKGKTGAAGEDGEALFRNWFKIFFVGRYKKAKVSAEEEKGKGRIDLKVAHPDLGTHIIEFKGWWNKDKKNLAAQLCSYLTDFEKHGYVFMINPLARKNITAEYKELVTSPEMHYTENSWKEHTVEGADFSYYESRHQFGIKVKIIYHFIFNVHFSHQRGKKR